MKRVGLVMAFVLLAAMSIGPPSQAATAPPAMRLPFAPGFTAVTSGPHTWDGTATGPRGSVDFGSADGSEQLVYAAAGGRARVYGDDGWSRCYVVVDHGNGWSTAYYHLKNVPADLNGKTIAAGAVVGNMGAIGVDTCGGGTPGYRHVHFVLMQNEEEYPINGLSLGGYTIHEAPGPYCGWWTRDSDGATVASSLTLQPPSATWPEGRCPRMEPGLTNGGTPPPPPPPPSVLSPTPTPTISGTAAVGQTLTAVPGTWGPAPVTLTYQWYRGAAAISGATAASYAVQAGDVGSTVKVAVTGSKSGYPSVTKTSAATATVAAAALSPTPTPTISGTAKVGQTLTAVPGTWGPAPVTLTYRWYRGATVISGATAATYPVQAADVGSTVKVAVTGSRAGYASVTKTSATTATVVPATSTPTPPAIVGNFEGARVSGNGVEVVGWAIDPDTTAAIYVWVTVDGVGRHMLANVNRPDVGAFYPAYGPRHGFSGVVAAAPGTHKVCVTASNVGPGSHKALGCRTVTVPLGGAPFGNFEGARATANGIEVKGWAIDPDTTASIYVWVTVDGVGRHMVANVNRPDVGAFYPASGPRHGFSGVVAAAPGTRQVCVTASNVGPGSHKPLGCRTVSVPAG